MRFSCAQHKRSTHIRQGDMNLPTSYPAPADPTAPAIRVSELCKHYRVHHRKPGLAAAVGSLFHRTTRLVRAVDGIGFSVAKGEIVGFLGPNGAGKTTTLKMLAGLLHPTSGQLQVLGHIPYKRQGEYLGRIALVMGQRNQLIWDIPAADSFELNRAVYRIPKARYDTTLDRLTRMLELTDLVSKPVRNLSLGERMKCEIAGALLHEPSVLFLDEPTIGLDVMMQRRIRSFIRDYNRQTGATVLLTSHYMADVEALCRRVIVIHHGKLLFDGDLASLVERFSSRKTIAFKTETAAPDLSELGEVQVSEDGRYVMKVPKRHTACIIEKLLKRCSIADLTVEDPPIEDAIEQVFLKGVP
jgi:ABC-2 type transport system ATP-binding protein